MVVVKFNGVGLVGPSILMSDRTARVRITCVTGLKVGILREGWPGFGNENGDLIGLPGVGIFQKGRAYFQGVISIF